MNKDIKETLDYVFSLAIGEAYTCEYEDIQKAKDCITNLQKENEILKENAIHNDKVVDKARWNEMIYKSRINKALEDIEFVLKSINQEKDMSTDERTRNEMTSCSQILNETLKELRGEDNE